MKREKITFNKRLIQTAICFVSLILFCSVVFAQSEIADANTHDSECIPCAQSFEKGIFFKMNNISDQNDTVSIRASSSGMEIEEIFAYAQNNTVIYEYDEAMLNYTRYLSFKKTPYYEGTILTDPIEIYINKVNTETVKVKYSLYTFKKEIMEKASVLVDWNDQPMGDATRHDRLYELTICTYLVQHIRDQTDIDKNFDKIYEFGPFTETPSETSRILYWDGKTDPNLTGSSLPVRACLYVAAHNAETGELIATGVSYRAIENYEISIYPPMTFTVNKDENGKESLSAKITLAFDDRPVKFTAYIATSHCQAGFPWYDIVNQGADAMIAVMNANDPAWFSSLQGPFAYKELTNPIVDPENSMIRTYEWKDIKKINWNDPKWKNYLKGNKGGQAGTLWPWYPQPEMDGDYFVPKADQEYVMGILVEALDNDGNPIPTFTGINQGSFIYSHEALDIPLLTNPQTIVGTSLINADNKIAIGTDGSGNIHLIYNDGSSTLESYVLINMVGQTVKSGRLSGSNRETITATDLHAGIYVITVNSKGGGKYSQKIVIK